MGGCCYERGLAWRYQWPDHIVDQFNGTGPLALFTNELELASMVINAYAVLLLAKHTVPA